jgi:hypothetical protein
MQEHCADVRIPHLYAFGFADGSRVRVSAHPLCSYALSLVPMLMSFPRFSLFTFSRGRGMFASATAYGNGSIACSAIPFSRITSGIHGRRPSTLPICSWSTLGPRPARCSRQRGLGIASILADRTVCFAA